jgi:hypothetical protein
MPTRRPYLYGIVCRAASFVKQFSSVKICAAERFLQFAILINLFGNGVDAQAN